MAGLSFLVSTPAFSKGYQCAPRVIAQNIQSAVLALKATKYCTSTDLPYSAAQASIRIESLRCGAEASSLIDELLYQNEGRYKLILTKDENKIACNSAINISMK